MPSRWSLLNLAIERAEKGERIDDGQAKSLTVCVPIQQRGDRQALASETLEELEKFLLPIAPFQQSDRELVIDFGPCEFCSHVSGVRFLDAASRKMKFKMYACRILRGSNRENVLCFGTGKLRITVTA